LIDSINGHRDRFQDIERDRFPKSGARSLASCSIDDAYPQPIALVALYCPAQIVLP
jgi:hypothetical protein